MGTDDPSAFLSVPAAIDFQNANDWRTVRRACHELLADASRRIVDVTGHAPLTPDSIEWWAQMRAIPLPPCDPKQVQARLWNEYHIEVPCFEWEGIPLIRISIQAYNTSADIDRLLEKLNRILKEMGYE
jgi:Selenocysteine lyase